MRPITAALLAVTLISPLQLFGQQETTHLMSLHAAALQGNIDAVRQYIRAGSDLNAKDAWGSTPLIIAATFGKTEVARALIEGGADLEIRDNTGSTPLHIAAFFGRPEIVKALLERGADRFSRNNAGSTAFDIVAAPFEDDKPMYDHLGAALGPLGLTLDYSHLKAIRPRIAGLLRPRTKDLKAVTYTPLRRNDWKVSTPVEQGLDPMLLAEFYGDAAAMPTLYGLLVVRNGNLIAERYFNEGSVEQLSKRASVTKSYVSALVGIALDRGCLSNLDQKMITFFPRISGDITDPRKKEITIREMLQMRAGYPWEETDSSLWNAIWSGDYIHNIIDFPLSRDPGAEFQYSNLTSHWLGIIVARACGADLKSFGEEYLFSPLGVKVGGWNQDIDGYYIGGGDIQFTARDMAKFGLLYLNEGRYKGNQIIPATWVRESLRRYSDTVNTAGVKSGRVGRYFRDVGYGFQWWSARAGAHRFSYAWGHGGQLIVVLNELRMVVVATADSFYGKETHRKAWKHEQGIINLVGKFITSLPPH